MRVAIVGGGLMGLALGERLSARGTRVDVLEVAPQLGGLTTHHDFGPFVWDRFYHVILPSDTRLLGFLKDLGLQDEIRWQATRTGYFVDGDTYSLSTPLEMLRFPLLGPIEKARLAYTILYCSRIRDWRRLETVSVEEWLIRVSGRRAYEKFWKPLLLAKLGEEYRRVSAVFIWTYVRRIFSARDSGVGNEQLGHVSGGYRTVFRRLEERIQTRGGTVETRHAVEAIEADKDGGLSVLGPDGPRHYDRVVFTGPTDALAKVVPSTLAEVVPGEAPVEYLGVLCSVVVSRAPLTPFYVLNIADGRVPFTGAIGMSNVVDPDETAGLHLTYLPRYLPSGDPAFDEDDDEVRERFLSGARMLFPHLEESGVVSVHVNRARRVQPLQVIDFSRRVPDTTTHHPHLYVLNTAQFVNNTLNNNEVIRAVDDFVEAHGENLVPSSPQSLGEST